MMGEDEKEAGWRIIWPILACLFILALAYLAMIGDH